MKQKLSLTGILIHNQIEGGYTAVLAEFPEVVAEGNTEEEAQSNLIEALQMVAELRKEDFINDLQQDDNVITKNFELELA